MKRAWLVTRRASGYYTVDEHRDDGTFPLGFGDQLRFDNKNLAEHAARIVNNAYRDGRQDQIDDTAKESTAPPQGE